MGRIKNYYMSLIEFDLIDNSSEVKENYQIITRGEKNLCYDVVSDNKSVTEKLNENISEA